MEEVEITKKIYKASDGTEFLSKEACEDYEKFKLHNKQVDDAVSRCRLGIKINGCDLLKITSKDDFKLIVESLKRFKTTYIVGGYNPKETIYWFENYSADGMQVNYAKLWLQDNSTALKTILNSISPSEQESLGIIVK